MSSYWDDVSRGFERALEQFNRDQRERKAQKYRRQMAKALQRRKKRGTRDK